MRTIKSRDLIRLEEANEEQKRFGLAFERAVYQLIMTKSVDLAYDEFVHHFGEVKYGAFVRLRLLRPLIEHIVDVVPAPPVQAVVGSTTVSVQADFIVRYNDGKKEIWEIKSHALKPEEYKIKAEWVFSVKLMRYMYRLSGYDYPVALIYFLSGKEMSVEKEVYSVADDHIIAILLSRLRSFKLSFF